MSVRARACVCVCACDCTCVSEERENVCVRERKTGKKEGRDGAGGGLGRRGGGNDPGPTNPITDPLTVNARRLTG